MTDYPKLAFSTGGLFSSVVAGGALDSLHRVNLGNDCGAYCIDAPEIMPAGAMRKSEHNTYGPVPFMTFRSEGV